MRIELTGYVSAYLVPGRPILGSARLQKNVQNHVAPDTLNKLGGDARWSYAELQRMTANLQPGG